MRDLDALDMKLLDALQRDASLPHKRLAEVCGVSEATMSRRIAALRKRGYLSQCVAVLDRRKLKRGLTVFTLVRLEREHPAESKRLAERWRRASEVLTLSFISGEYDYLLEIVVENMEDYQRFAEEYFIEEEAVKHYLSVFEMKSLKRTTSLPLSNTA